MSHAGDASLHINMAKLIAEEASNQARQNQDTAAAAQAATATAGLAEAVLHLADQVSKRNP